MANINFERFNIKMDLDSKGFTSSTRLVLQIEELNKVTGRKNSVYDISQAYTRNLYKMQPDIQNKVNKIGDNLRSQEQKRMQKRKQSLKHSKDYDLER